nr:MAG TPA: hypothetical protein [Microviridae sp.]
MSITVVTSIRGKYTNYSHNHKRKLFFLDSTVKCELRVYRQGDGEFERITRIYFVRN